MKKMFFFAAMAAVMASCTSEEPMMVSNGNGTAIGFDTYVGKATRAGDINTANLTSFYVYGGKAADDFNGTTVTKTDAGWTYSPTQYWEKDAKYTFAAVAPTNANVSFKDSKLTVADYTPGDDDLIVAVTNEITGQAAGSNYTVNLNFKHTLSKVQLTFSGDLTKPSTARLTGINNKATLSATYGNEGTAPTWSDATGSDDYTYNVDATTGKDVKYLLPQTIAPTAKISFTYNGKTYEKELATAEAGVDAWEMGKAYNYNVKLEDNDEISFSVTVAEWPTIGDEPATDPETPETPSDDPTEEPGDEPSETTAPETMVLTPTGDTWIRGNATTSAFASDTKMAIRNNSNGTDVYYSLVEFTLPENLKQEGYKISANLRLVTVQCKGNRNVNLYEYTGSDFEESSTYENIGETCKTIAEGTPITTFEAKGYGDKNMKDIDDSDTYTSYRTATEWTNNIDLSEYVNGKSAGSKFVLLISRATQDNAEMQFGTKEVKDIPNKDNSSLLYFKAEDLTPQLTITYTKE